MVIVGLTFLLILGIVLGAYFVFVVRHESADRSRLLGRLGKTAIVRDLLKPGDLEARTDRLSDVRAVQHVLSHARGLSAPLERLVTRSGLKITVGTLVIASLLAAFVGYLVVKWLTYSTYLGMAVAPLAGAVPLLLVRRACSKRLAKFEEQFPDAIDLIARALRAGHAFPTGLLMVADEAPAPIGPEFKLVYDRQNFGMPLNDALKGLAERVPILDARFFATAVLTQRETGGNLSEVLDNLATVIRDRFKVKRQVRVLTAHGRITGWILSALPVGLAVLISFVSPDHMQTMITDPLGIRMLAIAGTMQVVGTVIIRKLVNVPY
jgi:tight adherence protein B